jgi:hypothetical protein
MKAMRLIAALAAAGAIAAAGCGGDDDDAEAPSKAEYVASSNASCDRTQGEAGEAFERIVGKGRPSAAQAQRFLAEGVVPAIRENVTEREALTAPAGDEAEIEAMITAGKDALAEFERAAADRSAAVALMSGKTPDPAIEFDSLSKEYGIDRCGGD